MYKYLITFLIIFSTICSADVVWPITYYREMYYLSNGYFKIDNKFTPKNYTYLPNIVNSQLDPTLDYPTINGTSSKSHIPNLNYDDFPQIWGGNQICRIYDVLNLTETFAIDSPTVNSSSYAYSNPSFQPEVNKSCQIVDKKTFCISINTNWQFMKTSYIEITLLDNLWLFIDNELVLDNGGYTVGTPQTFKLDFETNIYDWCLNGSCNTFQVNTDKFIDRLVKLDIFHCNFKDSDSLSIQMRNHTYIKPTETPTPTPTPPVETKPPVIGECDRDPKPFKCNKGGVAGVAIAAAAVAAIAVGAAVYFGKKQFASISMPNSQPLGNVQDNPLFQHRSSTVDNLIYDPKA